MDIDNACDFCGIDEDNVMHVLYIITVYTRLFWIDY